MSESSKRELRIAPADKAYVRNGDWEDLNWREINAKIGVDTNNAEPLYLKNAPKETGYGREILMSFDLSEIEGFDYKHILFLPSFSKIDSSKKIAYDLYLVDADAWDGNTVAWKTKPAYKRIICKNTQVSGLCRSDITEAVDEAIANGKTKISFAMVISTEGAKNENRINPKTTTLVAANSDEVESFTKKLVADEEKNAQIWDWAQKVYEEWYAHYKSALERGLPTVKKIESDQNQYTKVVHTAKTGFPSESGWTRELAGKYAFNTRTYEALDDLGKYSDYNKEPQFDIYGGLLEESRKQEAKGFFYSKKINGRWWVIDPLGYPCYVRAVHAVYPSYLSSANQKREAEKTHGSLQGWQEWVCDKLKNEWYFNVGDSGVTSQNNPIVQQIGFGYFISSYGRRVGTNSSCGGSTVFSQNNTMNIFDPDFVAVADEIASKLSDNVNNPMILGYTTDNELPMDINMIYNYLSLDCTNPANRYSYACAWNWLINILGKKNPVAEDITDEITELFRGFVWDRYFYVVTSAMRKYDPNHMILGTRFLTDVMDAKWVLRFASMYLDGLTVNWYGQWEPDAENLKKMCTYADLPLMVTEFYTKAFENGGGFQDPPIPLANTRGAGWVVPTQADRGDFYQNFTLRLLECKNFVGWHWHQYIDDDPSPETIYKEDGKTYRDQSNIDANKGIVDNRHIPYGELVSRMAEINKNVYRLIDHFDAKYK